MFSKIMLLTGEVEAPALAEILRAHRAELVVEALTPGPAMDALAERSADGERLEDARLIAFCTAVIVPEAVLTAFPGPSYNFHPGPPSYPGSHPASFAIYEGAERYGVTVHEMTAQVDEGAIVAADWFDVPPGVGFAKLEAMAFGQLVATFKRLARHLATDPAPLPPSGDVWSGRKRTKKDALRFKELPPDVSEEEIRRRYRAFG